ncbi:MAG TPA: Calx-beta domain-containing protein, partial [Thermoanaerobaculia bacterium]|nr:Calx-beta domain-containing protein [Thermoanaerobaculia bacterium]
MTTYRSILPAFALGFLLTASAWGQHHVIGNVDYDPEPRGGDDNAPAGCVGVPAKIEINSTGTAFLPATVTVDKGQPVCWTWASPTLTHNISSSDGFFSSGPPTGQGTFQKTFTAAGTFGFHCQVHGTASTGMRGTVIVRDPATGGEGPGTLEATSTYTVNENAGTLAVSVERVGGSDGAASVKYATAPGSAKSGKDFTTRKGTLKWTDGDQEPKSIEVPIKNDSSIEADESFAVKLSKATGAGLGNATSTVAIHDDDGPQCDAALLAPSQLRASGQSAGEIRLSWKDESIGATSFRIERRQDGGEFRKIASVTAGERTFVDSGLAGGATFQYRVRAEGTDGVSAFSAIVAGASDGSTAACDDTRALCLHNGRFEAIVEWHAPERNREAKRLFASDAPSWGLFFSGDDAPQLLLNVRDGCGINDRYWLDLGAVTDEALTVKVRDTQTGRTWAYFNP